MTLNVSLKIKKVNISKQTQMIINAKIIGQPYSGEYLERVYDNASEWNSQNWTFIKFTNDDYTDWCGQFRGFPVNVAISTVYNIVIVLTSDYFFQIDIKSGDLLEIEAQIQYQNLTSAPNGSFIISDFNNFSKITSNIKLKEKIESPIEMDIIEFKNWDSNKLEFTCDEFLNWDRHLTMLYDCNTNKIEIKNVT